MEFGIDAIDYYLPKLVLPIKALAEARDIPPAKLEKGLGLKAMALTILTKMLHQWLPMHFLI